MKRIGKVLMLIFGLILSITLIISTFVNWQIDNDIEGWKVRAQVSSEPNAMLKYMTNVKEGMEEWGMTSGHAVLLFTTPENDMGEIFDTVLNHVEQAEVLTTMDRDTPEYQTGLDNLRGSIRELDLYSRSYWKVHRGLVVMTIFWSSMVIVGIGFFMSTSEV